MVARPWVNLPPAITPETLAGLDARLKIDWRSFFASAGYEVRTERSTGVIRIRSQSSMRIRNLVTARPLTNKQGQMRSDADRTLSEQSFDMDMTDVLELASSPASFANFNNWGKLQLALWQRDNEIEALDEFISGKPGEMALYRLASSESYMKRQFLMSAISDLALGTAPEHLRLGSQRDDRSLIAGQLEIGPAMLVCSPLAARNQPLVVTLITRGGAQIAIIPRRGAFRRPARLAEWPNGILQQGLLGTGEGAYWTEEERIPSRYGEEMLALAVQGCNRLIEHMTDPAKWCDDAGTFDPELRWIGWSTILFGFNALGAVNENWSNSDEGLWAAFRALGMLQGLWSGQRPGSVRLSDLLNPERIREYAADLVEQDYYRSWAHKIVERFEVAVSSGFPSRTVEGSLRQLTEIRNLVHGVGTDRPGQRAVRLRALRAIDRQDTPALNLVMDIATLWWFALLMSPSTHARVGIAPWE